MDSREQKLGSRDGATGGRPKLGEGIGQGIGSGWGGHEKTRRKSLDAYFEPVQSGNLTSIKSESTGDNNRHQTKEKREEISRGKNWKRGICFG